LLFNTFACFCFSIDDGTTVAVGGTGGITATWAADTAATEEMAVGIAMGGTANMAGAEAEATGEAGTKTEGAASRTSRVDITKCPTGEISTCPNTVQQQIQSIS